MFVKVLAVLGFVAVAYAADLNVGDRGSKLIFEKNVTASPTIWRQIQNLTVNVTNDEEVISRIIVIDNRPGKDGEVKVVEGGEGEKTITLELKSPAVFRGFDFSIKVFAAAENENARSPNHPAPTGIDTQVPQQPKDISVHDNSNQEPKNTDDIILGAQKPTATPSTETNKDDQQQINNPALVGKDQTRLNRDTQDQITKDQTSVPTPVDVDATKDIKINENANKTEQPEIEENLKKDLAPSNSSEKTDDSQKVIPVMPQAEDEDLNGQEADLSDEEETRKVRQSYNPVVPALPKELKGDDDNTTPKSELSSTTAKNVEQKRVPSIVPITSEVPSTTSAEELVTGFKLQNAKTTQELEGNIKGHHFGHHHAVPLPYMN